MALLPIVPAVAEPQALDAIQQTATDFLLAQNANARAAPRISVTPPDPRLRVEACTEPLEAFIPPGQRLVGRTTVGIRCAAPTLWTLYVQATVAIYQPVLITRRPLPRGTPLNAADVAMVEKDIASLTLGYLSDIKEISGMRLKRSVSAGAVLHPGVLQPPVSVRRGERVTILGQTGGVEVRMEGQALMDGVKDEVIRVRNLSSGREIEGVVVAPGVIRVRL